MANRPFYRAGKIPDQEGVKKILENVEKIMSVKACLSKLLPGKQQQYCRVGLEGLD